MANQWCECCGEREAMTGYRVCSVCQTNSAVEQKEVIEALRVENEALRARVEALETAIEEAMIAISDRTSGNAQYEPDIWQTFSILDRARNFVEPQS